MLHMPFQVNVREHSPDIWFFECTSATIDLLALGFAFPFNQEALYDPLSKMPMRVQLFLDDSYFVQPG